MHIVQIAPPWFPIPPERYGGIERVVHDLIEGFIADGHQVTLFAPGDSVTKAHLIPTCKRGNGLDISQAEKTRIFQETSNFAFSTAISNGADIIHDHTDYVWRGVSTPPVVHTMHGPATAESLAIYARLTRRGDHLIAISQRQRELFESASLEGTGNPGNVVIDAVIHNPIDVSGAPFYPASQKSDYLAFVGRCHWEKGPATAIAVAKASGIPLKMAMRVSHEEQEYYDEVVRPLLDANRGLVEFAGELGGKDKDDLIGQARALIFSSLWEEPFGLVLTESLARGTPVVAFERGSAPEVLQHRVTGALCATEAEMASAIPWVMTLAPAVCRADAKARFDRGAIARRHVELFAQLIAEKESTQPRGFTGSGLPRHKRTGTGTIIGPVSPWRVDDAAEEQTAAARLRRVN